MTGFLPRRHEPWWPRRRPQRRRARLADALEQAIAAAGSARDPWSYAAPMQRAEAREARTLLLELVRRLREPEAVPPRALRALERLHLDPCSPLYAPGEPGALRAVVLDATFALDRARPGAR